MQDRWRSFKGIVRLWTELFARENILTYAYAIALQALIGTIAFLLLGVGILGATHDKGLWSNTAGPAIERRALPDVYSGLNEIVQRVFASSSTGLIVFAAILAIWEVSGVARAISGALDVVYGAKDERSSKVRLPISLGISIAFNVALLGAIVLVAGVHAPGAWEWPVAAVRWIGAVGLLMLAFGLLVRWAPAKPRAKKWANGGAILVVSGWIVETLVFRWYVTSVADYRSAIGSFAAFIVLTTYLYVGAIILLVAMEVDELVRLDAQRPRNHQQLLPLVVGVIRGSWLAEAGDGASPATLRLGLAVLRRSGRDEILEQVLRQVRDLVDGAVERRLVRLRRLGHAADLAHVLQRRRVDLVRARGRIEVVENANIPAHGARLLRGAGEDEGDEVVDLRRAECPEGRRHHARRVALREIGLRVDDRLLDEGGERHVVGRRVRCRRGVEVRADRPVRAGGSERVARRAAARGEERLTRRDVGAARRGRCRSGRCRRRGRPDRDRVRDHLRRLRAERGVVADRPARETGREKEQSEEDPDEDFASGGPRIPSPARHGGEPTESRRRSAPIDSNR